MMRDELGLAESVILPGAVSEQLRSDLLAATSVLAHPARLESLGLSILEAMTVGKPVVAASSDGARFLLRDGRDGVLVPPGNPQALGEALSELLRNPVRQRELGVVGQERARGFSNDEMVQRIEAVWDTLLE
jgi:glycosyltransferase involved in cell wall biosynthesis